MSVKKKTSCEGYAIASVVLGSLSLMLFWVPYIGFVFSFFAFVLAAIALYLAFVHYQKPTIVYIALGLSLLVMAMAGKVTLKTNEIIENFAQETKFIFKDYKNTNTKVIRDSNKIHIIIDDNNTIDSINIEFENLEEIMDSFEDSIHIDFN